MVDLTKHFPGGYTCAPAPVVKEFQYQDALAEFANELQAAGLTLKGTSVADGEIHRIADASARHKNNDSGWYVLTEAAEGLFYGSYGSWRRGETASWSSKDRARWTASDREAIKVAEENRTRKQEEEFRCAAEKARSIIASAEPAKVAYPYLATKRIGANGILQLEGRLIVPVMQPDGTVSSLQWIDASGDKWFLEGGKVRGGSFQIGQVRNKILVCEGFATGASIHEASGEAVVVAFNAGNLKSVVEGIRERYALPILICGDNDQWTEGNPGDTKAREASQAVANASYILPKFSSLNGNPTDFNDLATREGSEAVRAQCSVTPDNTLPLIWASQITLDLASVYIIKGLLDAGTISVVYGQSNVGKSFFAIDLAAHVAAGLSWRDKRVVQGGVVYVAAESASSVKRRIWAWCQEHDAKDIPLAVVTTAVDLRDPSADTTRLIDTIKAASEGKFPICLVVIDTLSRSFGGGDENSSKDMSTYIANVDKIRTATGAHVLIVHHAGKDDAKGARGHSSLRAATDTEVSLRRADNSRFSIASVDKQRDGESGEKLLFRLQQVDLGEDQDGDPVTTCIVVSVDNDGAHGGSKLTPREQAAQAVLREHWEKETPGIEGEGVTFKEFRKLMLSSGVVNEVGPRVTQRLYELRGGLRKKGLITMAKGRVSFLTAPAQGTENAPVH